MNLQARLAALEGIAAQFGDYDAPRVVLVVVEANDAGRRDLASLKAAGLYPGGEARLPADLLPPDADAIAAADLLLRCGVRNDGRDQIAMPGPGDA